MVLKFDSLKRGILFLLMITFMVVISKAQTEGGDVLSSQNNNDKLSLFQEYQNSIVNVDAVEESYNETSPDDIPDLEESYAINAIKKANVHNSDVISSEFKKYWDKIDAEREWVLLGYGFGIDIVEVRNPEIKILEIIPRLVDRETLVIFDFCDMEDSDMGWAGENDSNPKICAMIFKYENGQWVVDDFFEALGMGRADVDKFNKDNVESTKTNIKGLLDQN